MANNHCPEAFWMGVLKNRDLKASKEYCHLQWHHFVLL